MRNILVLNSILFLMVTACGDDRTAGRDAAPKDATDDGGVISIGCCHVEEKPSERAVCCKDGTWESDTDNEKCDVNGGAGEVCNESACCPTSDEQKGSICCADGTWQTDGDDGCVGNGGDGESCVALGETCGTSAEGLSCNPDLNCCYPCGVDGCDYECAMPCAIGQDGCVDGCLLFP